MALVMAKPRLPRCVPENGRPCVVCRDGRCRNRPEARSPRRSRVYGGAGVAKQNPPHHRPRADRREGLVPCSPTGLVIRATRRAMPPCGLPRCHELTVWRPNSLSNAITIASWWVTRCPVSRSRLAQKSRSAR